MDITRRKSSRERRELSAPSNAHREGCLARRSKSVSAARGQARRVMEELVLALGDNIARAITTIAGQTPQDVTTATLPDTTEMRLSAGRTTAQFVRTVRPNGSIPAAPMGHVRSDATTFYGTSPDARVVFEAAFFNDFQPGGATAARYRVTIVAVGRTNAELDRREVFVVVPASAAQLAL